MSFIFDKLLPPQTNVLKYAFKPCFESIPGQNTVSEVLKHGIFLLQHFARQVNGEAIAPRPSGYATDYSSTQTLNLVCVVLFCHKP